MGLLYDSYIKQISGINDVLSKKEAEKYEAIALGIIALLDDIQKINENKHFIATAQGSLAKKLVEFAHQNATKKPDLFTQSEKPTEKVVVPVTGMPPGSAGVVKMEKKLDGSLGNVQVDLVNLIPATPEGNPPPTQSVVIIQGPPVVPVSPPPPAVTSADPTAAVTDDQINAALAKAQTKPAAKPEPKQDQVTALKRVASKDYWACDNPKCGSDDLVFVLGIMTVKQAGDTVHVDYECRACGQKHGALLANEEVQALNKLGGEFVHPTTNQHVADAPAATPAPAAQEAAEKPKRGRKKAADPVTEVKGGKQPKGTTFHSSKTPDEIAAIVTGVIGGAEKEIDEEALLKTVEPQVRAWELDKLVKEWEAMTGQTYEQGKTVPDVMVEDVARQLAGLPVKARTA